MPDIFTPKTENKTQGKKPLPSYAAVNTETNPVFPFTAYCENPSGITLQKELPDEKILLLLKRHFITNLPWLIITILFIFIPPLLSIVFTFAQPPVTLPASFVTVLVLLYYLAIFSYAFINFLTWFYNVLLVTQKRIIDIDFSDIVFHNVVETKLSLVEEVNYTQGGLFATFFNYGDVIVQTAAEKVDIESPGVPNPGRVVRIIGNLIGKEKHV